jgi:hypothetical protein
MLAYRSIFLGVGFRDISAVRNLMSRFRFFGLRSARGVWFAGTRSTYFEKSKDEDENDDPLAVT